MHFGWLSGEHPVYSSSFHISNVPIQAGSQGRESVWQSPCLSYIQLSVLFRYLNGFYIYTIVEWFNGWEFFEAHGRGIKMIMMENGEDAPIY